MQILSAVVTHPLALASIEFLAHECHLKHSSAYVRLFTIVEDRVESVNVFILTSLSVVIVSHNEEVIPLPITIVVVQNALCLLLVSTRPTTLLGVTFKTLRHRVVNDEPHILLVDSHTEGYSSYDDLNLVLHPSFLNDLPLLVGQLCMVVVALYSIRPLQNLTQLLALLPTYTVDDACLVSEP